MHLDLARASIFVVDLARFYVVVQIFRTSNGQSYSMQQGRKWSISVINSRKRSPSVDAIASTLCHIPSCQFR